MKILHIIFAFRLGGAETMLVDIMNRQVAAGDDVRLLIVNNETDPSLIAAIDPKVKVECWGRRPGSNKIGLALRINLWIRRIRPDIVHLHDYKLVALIRGMDSRLIYTVHDLGLPQSYLRPTVKQVAITDAVRQDVLRRMPDADVCVIHNGIDVHALRGRDHRKMPGKVFRIVQSGRLEAVKKGQDILIRALAILVQKGYLNINVDFIGEGSDHGNLASLASELGVGDYVRFCGKMPRADLYGSYADYDLMVHPSRYEGFGLIIAEAMAAGLPVAVPESGGPCEVVCGGEYGELFAMDSPESCARAIERILSTYPDALERAERAREYAVANYSLDAMVACYRELYEEMLRSHE